jgi:hypothetical protein
MFAYNLGEEPAPLYTPYSPYTPASVPGSIPSFIPGSAYSEYGPVSSGIYGKVTRENVAREEYTANEESNMEGMGMFKLDQQIGTYQESMGAEEEFGPPVPTMTQKIVQYATDETGLQKNILYSIGAGVAAYIIYRIYYDV